MRKKSPSGSHDSQKTRQVVYQRGNQRDGSPNYVFLYSDDDEENEEDGNYPLKVMAKHKSNPRKVEVINVEVRSEDTLQALSLNYRCTISELKRINNIHKDNEIFAHKHIKVPVKPFSILTEPNQDVETSLFSRNDQLISLLDTPENCTGVDINKIILNSTVEPLVHHSSQTEPVDLVEHSCTDRLITDTETGVRFNSSSDKIVNSLACSGADWGLSWFQLLCFFLILGVAGPILYVIYIKEKELEIHNRTSLHDNISERIKS